MKFLDNKQYEYDEPFSAALNTAKNTITESPIWHTLGIKKSRWVDKLNGVRRRNYIISEVNANKKPEEDGKHVELNNTEETKE